MRHHHRTVFAKHEFGQGNAGFTLIELMITVAIVAIIASIAYPSYQSHIAKTRRGVAKACLSELAQYMERYYTTNQQFHQSRDSTPVANSLPNLQCRTELTGSYTFGFPVLTAATYELRATPTAAQIARDTQCGRVLTLNQSGTRGARTTAGVAEAAAVATACWN